MCAFVYLNRIMIIKVSRSKRISDRSDADRILHLHLFYTFSWCTCNSNVHEAHNLFFEKSYFQKMVFIQRSYDDTLIFLVYSVPILAITACVFLQLAISIGDVTVSLYGHVKLDKLVDFTFNNL